MTYSPRVFSILLSIVHSAMVFAGTPNRAIAAGRPDESSRLEKIARLERELDTIRMARSSSWLDDTKREQLRALTIEAPDDASRHRSLLADNGSAGYDGGPFLASDDGSFTLEIAFQHQLRFVHTHRDDSGVDDDINGFELRRTKLFFSGNAFGPDLEYKITLSFDRNGGLGELSDAWLRWRLCPDVRLQAGQFKHPLIYEELLSSSRQLTVDRSYVNALRTLGRAQGIMLDWERDALRIRVSFNEGVGIDPDETNSKWTNTAFNAEDNEHAFTARGDLVLTGDPKQFRDYTSWSEDGFAALVGAAAHWQKDEVGTSSFEDEFLIWTADAHLEFGGGVSLAGALVGSYIDSNDPTMPIYNQIGGMIQGGVHVVPDEVELFARYEWFDFDGATNNTTNSNFSALTAGVNWFMHNQHNVKFSTDVIWAFDPVPDGSSGVGLFDDTANADDQLVWRNQLSLRW